MTSESCAGITTQVVPWVAGATADVVSPAALAEAGDDAGVAVVFALDLSRQRTARRAVTRDSSHVASLSCTLRWSTLRWRLRRRWSAVQEHAQGAPAGTAMLIKAIRDKNDEHQIPKVGEKRRAMMP